MRGVKSVASRDLDSILGFIDNYFCTYFTSPSYEEIAEYFDITRPTVMNRINRLIAQGRLVKNPNGRWGFRPTRFGALSADEIYKNCKQEDKVLFVASIVKIPDVRGRNVQASRFKQCVPIVIAISDSLVLLKEAIDEFDADWNNGRGTQDISISTAPFLSQWRTLKQGELSPTDAT